MFNTILVYYAVTYVFFFIRIDSFVKDIVVTPLFFLVPTGVGLLLFSIFGFYKKLLQFLSKTQLILSSTFFGFLFISLLYTELNNRNYLSQSFFLLYPLINILSFLGFYRLREIIEINDNLKTYLKTFVIITPVIFLSYYFSYIHFTQFPLRDIYVETLFMKGALELSKYYVLNPETGNTYFALLQVHEGVLNHFYKFDLINAQWIMPIYLSFFHYLCFLCFYSSFIEDRFTRNVAIGLTFISVSSIFSNSNNEYLLLLCSILFSVLVSKNKEQKNIGVIILELLAFGIIAILFYKNRQIPSYSQTILPFLMSSFFILLLIGYFKNVKLLSFGFVVLLLMIAPPFHRASVLYLPIVLFMYAIYFISFQWHKTNGVPVKKALLRKILLYTLFCLPAGILIGFLISRFWPSGDVSGLFYYIYISLGGDGAYTQSSIKGVLAEWLRTIAPVMHLIFLLLGIITFTIFVRKKGENSDYLFNEANISLLIFSILSSVIFIIVIFSPVPSVYRILFFPALLISAAIALLFKLYKEIFLMKSKNVLSAIILSGFILIYNIIARYIYWLPWENGRIKNHYISLLFPIPEVLTSIILICTYILIVIQLLKWKKSWAYIYILSVLISAVALDRFMLTSKLFENNYPYTEPAPKVISHYSLVEFNAAKTLDRIISNSTDPDGLLMVSDPYTLGIFRAVTGLNHVFTFANLDLIQEKYQNEIKFIIRNMFPKITDKQRDDYNLNADTSTEYRLVSTNSKEIHDRNKRQGYKEKTEYSLELLNKSGNYSPEFEYMQRKKNPYKETDLRLLKDKIIWIVNEKTIEWAYGKVGYYPQNKEFTKDYIEENILPYFDVIHNAENKVFVLKLR